MKNRGLTIVLATALGACAAQAQQKDVVLRSMLDELERSKTIALPGLEQPYFIEYTLEDVEGFTTSASLGATIANGGSRFRVPRIRLRVGSYQFDNSNYVLSALGMGSGQDSAVLDNNYAVLRRGWWLLTDRAYKSAVEAIARKRAALKNLTQPEALPDFWPAQPVQKFGPVQKGDTHAEQWKERVRQLSMVFRAYPDIVSSNIMFSNTRSVSYMVNSEGSATQKAEPLANLQIQASTFAADGTVVRSSLSVPRNDDGHMPSQEELSRMVTQVAEDVRALAKAPAGESYAGPVLFEGIAGPQLLAELLGPNLVAARRPVAEPGRSLPWLPGEFDNRLESRILPEYMNVVDDPTIREWKGTPLLGHYELDDEGLAAKPVRVVENGRLKSFLLTRQPVRGQSASNGRARLPGSFGAAQASISNLFVSSSEPVKAADLKARYLKLLADSGKPWGIIVRRMDFPSGASMEEARRLVQAAQQSGAVRPVSAPALCYRVYPDGREELVRGLRFRGLTVRALRDIQAASEEQYALHYLNNQLPFALMSAGGYVAGVSVVGPALLFDELELERSRDDVPTPPLVPAPELRANASR